MEINTTTPEQVITSKKMKMIYGYVFSYTLNQKQLDDLLKTPLVKLEVKLEKMEMKYLMDRLRGKITTEPIKK
jgi:replication initiation and membrane attachment protein DnaB